MTKYFICIILLLSSSSKLYSQTILVLGDSISAGYGIKLEQGWVALLENKLNADTPNAYTVVNASISGETSGGGLARLPALLQRYKPNIVVVELGGNDGLRGYPIHIMQNNLNQIVQLSQQAQAQVLLVGMRIPPNYGKRYTQAFFASFQKVAHQNSISLLPFFLADIALDPDSMQQDGIHPNANGQVQLLDNIWESLQELLALRDRLNP